MRTQFFLIALVCSFFEVALATTPRPSEDGSERAIDKKSVSGMSLSSKGKDLEAKGSEDPTALEGVPEPIGPALGPLKPEDCTLEEIYLFGYQEKLQARNLILVGLNGLDGSIKEFNAANSSNVCPYVPLSDFVVLSQEAKDAFRESPLLCQVGSSPLHRRKTAMACQLYVYYLNFLYAPYPYNNPPHVLMIMRPSSGHEKILTKEQTEGFLKSIDFINDLLMQAKSFNKKKREGFLKKIQDRFIHGSAEDFPYKAQELAFLLQRGENHFRIPEDLFTELKKQVPLDSIDPKNFNPSLEDSPEYQKRVLNVRTFFTKATENYADALFCLGRAYAQGYPGFVSQNPDRALKLLHEAAYIESREETEYLGSVKALAYLATSYRYGRRGFVEKDLPKALDYLERAAAANDPESLHSLAQLYDPSSEEDGWGALVTRDSLKAYELYLRAANFGSEEAQVFLAQKYERADTEGDGSILVHGQEPVVDFCFQDVPQGPYDEKLFCLAKKSGLLKHKGVLPQGSYVADDEEDYDRALWELAKKQGAGWEGRLLADDGLSGERNALRLYEMAAKDECPEALFALAQKHEFGWMGLVEKDLHKALNFLVRAAKQHHEEALLILVQKYQSGWEGVLLKDESMAKRLLRAHKRGYLRGELGS